MTHRRVFLLAPIAVLVAACASQLVSTPVSVADTIARDPELSTLNTLVQQAGLGETLKTQAPITVFAPTNDAFKAVPAKTMAELAGNPAKLRAVLTFHVVPQKLSASDVKNGDVKTAEGAKLALSKSGEYVTAEDAMVQHADIVATNGVVHTVDRVLMPPASH